MHPKLHPTLSHFSFLSTLPKIIGSEQIAVTFLQEIGLLPSEESKPPLCCGLPMVTEANSCTKIGWCWRCATKPSKKKGAKGCRRSVSPCSESFFDGSSCHIKICDALAIILCFVNKMPVSWTYNQLRERRLENDEYELSSSTVNDYYKHCREVAEVISSHSQIACGGKTVHIDEAFFTMLKYNHGGMTKQVNVLGLYCKRDKVGLYLKANSEKMSDLLPHIQTYVQKSTGCVSAVEELFGKENVHVNADQNEEEGSSSNIINQSVVCRRTTKLDHKNMALNFYRRHHLEGEYPDHLGSQIMQFLLDVHKVYPGNVDGELRKGLEMREIDPSSQYSESEDNSPSGSKKCRVMKIGNEEDDEEWKEEMEYSYF